MSSKLYAKLGTMAAGKSLELLKTADTYERSGRRVLIFTPNIDNRYGKDRVVSRTGLGHEATSVHIDDAEQIYRSAVFERPDVILIDECQFFTKRVIETLAVAIVDGLNIPVICYGLKTNFKGELFEGSAELFALADDISEIKGLCQCCDRKATMNLRFVDGNPAKEGDEVLIGDEEYRSVCRKHFYDWEEF
ncbi:thymidine kinase [Bacillus cereus]|uniref:thymidine kinase n=1 Tax=Bacillus cereus TaxID=1396 RepID=UPI000BEDEBD3|nr:thymidine kinase [Bacillus cereus]PEF92000.1 thymidine kinase [Bacillus cereus]